MNDALDVSTGAVRKSGPDTGCLSTSTLAVIQVLTKDAEVLELVKVIDVTVADGLTVELDSLDDLGVLAVGHD